MKERTAEPQFGERKFTTPDNPKGSDGQQSARDNSPTAKELTEKKGGAMTREQSIQDAEKEEQEDLEKKKREWSAEAFKASRDQAKVLGDLTMESKHIPLNRRGPKSFDERPGRNR